jgi:hypothetical protein
MNQQECVCLFLLLCTGILPPMQNNLPFLAQHLQQQLSRQQQAQQQQQPEAQAKQQLRNHIAALSIAHGLLSLLAQLLKHMPSEQLSNFHQGLLPLTQPAAALAMVVLRLPHSPAVLSCCSSRAVSLYSKIRSSCCKEAYAVGAVLGVQYMCMPGRRIEGCSSRGWCKAPQGSAELQAVQALASAPVQQLLLMNLASAVEAAAVEQGNRPGSAAAPTKQQQKWLRQQQQQQQDEAAVPQHHRQLLECLGLPAEDDDRTESWLFSQCHVVLDTWGY